MTIRKLLALLAPYAEGAEDGYECEVTIDPDDEELVIDMGSDVHRYTLEHSDACQPGDCVCGFGKPRFGATPGRAG